MSHTNRIDIIHASRILGVKEGSLGKTFGHTVEWLLTLASQTLKRQFNMHARSCAGMMQHICALKETTFLVPRQFETLRFVMREVRHDYGTATAAEQARYLPTPGPSRAGRTSRPNAGLLGALLHAVPDLVQRSVPPGHVRAKAARVKPCSMANASSAKSLLMPSAQLESESTHSTQTRASRWKHAIHKGLTNLSKH